MPLRLERVASLQTVTPSAWNALAGDSPFLRHEFLTALERSGCVGRRTAWQPAYLLAKEGADLIGAIPLYMKYDSRGEFVFDWGWADAYERTGRRYYPKLVAAVPFTPATGTRLLVRPGADVAARARAADRRRARGRGGAPRLVAARAVPDRGGARAARGRRPVEPQGLSVPLAQRRLRRLRRLSRALQLREAQEGEARAAARRRGGDHVRASTRRRADRRRVGRDLRVLLAHFRVSRPAAVFESCVLRGDRAHDAGESLSCPRALPRHTDRVRDLLSRRRHALRPLLGQRRGLPQPALRDLLLPRHRVLHPRAAREVRARHAGRAQDQPRLYAERDLVVPLARRPRTFTTRSRSSSRARLITSTHTWTSSTSTCRTATTRCRRFRRRSPMSTLRWLSSADAADRFPPASQALTEPNGLLAAGGDLEPQAAARGLSARHLPVVRGGPADTLVEPGPARRAAAGKP